MAADYINRTALTEQLSMLATRYAALGREKVAQDYNWAVSVLDGAPAADVVEVVHGAWFLLDDCANAGLYCAVCHHRVHREDFAYKKLRSKYCPHCGAKMDGGENE